LGGAASWTRTDPTYTDIDDIDEGDGTDIVHRLGEEAEIVAQRCIEVAAAHIGGGDVWKCVWLFVAQEAACSIMGDINSNSKEIHRNTIFKFN